jgi:flagellin
MGLRINNDSQNFILRQIQGSALRVNDATRKLASGLRITRAADDAAGLAIAEGLRAEIIGAQAETGNIQNALSLTQTAEGGLGEITGGLQRLRELAVQASSGTLSDENRVALNAEAQQIIEQIDATAEGTEFNGINMLDGSVASVDVGTESGLAVEFDSATAGALGVDTVDLSTVEGAAAAMGQVDTAIGSVNDNRAGLGAASNALGSAISTREIAGENLTAARARIMDANIAAEVTNLVSGQILESGGIAALAQANIMPQSVINLLS